jgi:hypothetical protein
MTMKRFTTETDFADYPHICKVRNFIHLVREHRADLLRQREASTVSRNGPTIFSSHTYLRDFDSTSINKSNSPSTTVSIKLLATMAPLNDFQTAFLASLPMFDPLHTSTHDASCHCGAVQYTVTLSPPLSSQKIGSCNCTICLKNGYLLLYPRRQDVVIHQGEDGLKSHSFGPKQLLHKFCGECGSSVWHDPRLKMLGEEMPDLLGVNVSIRMLFVC